MTITVRINTDTPDGKRLEHLLQQYPASVEFISPAVSVEYSETEDNTISAAESAKQAFNRLGEKYNCTFDNKYTG